MRFFTDLKNSIALRLLAFPPFFNIATRFLVRRMKRAGVTPAAAESELEERNTRMLATIERNTGALIRGGASRESLTRYRETLEKARGLYDSDLAEFSQSRLAELRPESGDETRRVIDGFNAQIARLDERIRQQRKS